MNEANRIEYKQELTDDLEKEAGVLILQNKSK